MIDMIKNIIKIIATILSNINFCHILNYFPLYYYAYIIIIFILSNINIKLGPYIRQKICYLYITSLLNILLLFTLVNPAGASRLLAFTRCWNDGK